MSARASQVPSIFESQAFQVEAVRSEHARTRWMLVAFGAITVVAAGRQFLFRPDGWQRSVTLVLGLAAGFLVYEALMLVLIGARARAGRVLPQLVWRLNTVVESLFPTLVLTAIGLMREVGPYRALSMPAIALYYLAIMLATMRLRPGLCLLAGAVSAGGYAALVASTFLLNPEPPAHVDHPAVHATGAVFMLIAGAVAAAVADRVRRYLGVALWEIRQRQRAVLEARNTLIFGLAKLAEYRDTDTGAHLERISTYAALLAEALRGTFPEIDDEWIDTVRVASSMHDIGKVGIPDAVLQKPGRLTPEERAVMERHAALGADALRAIVARHGADPLLGMSDEIAIGHHERWDGGGYPGKIRGEDIALAARIISVADVYDALTSARVYKPALSHEEACRIIREGRGTQFDPVVVDAFIDVSARFDQIRSRHAASAPPPVPVPP